MLLLSVITMHRRCMEVSGELPTKCPSAGGISCSVRLVMFV